MPEFTDTELDLLRDMPVHVGHVIADPDDGIADMRDRQIGGGGHGLHYEYTRTAIEAVWREFIPVRWADEADIRPTGSPIKWRSGALLREARITYTRLHRWASNLPAGIRADALTHWRAWDIRALVDLALTAIDHDPEPALFDIQELTNA